MSLLRNIASSTCYSRWTALGSMRPYKSRSNNPSQYILADGIGGNYKGNSATASSSCRQTRSAKSLSNSSSFSWRSPHERDPGNGCSVGASLSNTPLRGTPIWSLGDPKKDVLGGSRGGLSRALFAGSRGLFSRPILKGSQKTFSMGLSKGSRKRF